MSRAAVGLIAGILLAIAATTGGVLGFVVAVVLGGIGLAVGAHYDGDIDITAVWRGHGRG